MLQFDDESHLCWFRNSSVASDDSHRDFFLLGVICALAIYNDNIVDIRFPLALYKKLLGKKVMLSDLKGTNTKDEISKSHELQGRASIRYKTGPAIRYKKGPSIRYIGLNFTIFF